jgi:KipI family sensor histidine kinase inhibitor
LSYPRLAALGDSAITVTFGEGISEILSARVVAHAKRIGHAGIAGVSDVVPSYAALTVYYDSLTVAYDDIRHRLSEMVREEMAANTEAERGVRRIGVRYDGEDLEEVARRTQLTREEVIRIHTAGDYRVFVIGFVPGFVYLGILDERLSLPRREAPRKRVPPGSVAIAERQTGVYPSATPGGWHLLGTTDETMFDANRDPPALLQVGDRVKFEAIA